MTPIRRTHIAIVALALTCAGGLASADTIVLEPTKDNTLIEAAAGGLSNGVGNGICCGRTAQGSFALRRALMAFDIAGAVPAGSTIDSVQLTLLLVQSNSGNQTCRLRRVLADWGEGTSFWPGCAGAASTTGDVTWINTFYPGQSWATPGGDFSATVRESQTVSDLETHFTWGSTAAMVADAQEWLDAPSTNFGWVLTGNETTSGSGKRFASREWPQASARPALSIEFTPPVAPCEGDADGSGTVDIDDIVLVVLNFDNTGAPGIPGDVNEDGVVNIDDIVVVVLNFGPC